MSVIEFPHSRRRSEAKSLNPLASFADMVPTDARLDARADELRQESREIVRAFSPDAVAEMLAYAAARLERVGFKMFRP